MPSKKILPKGAGKFARPEINISKNDVESKSPDQET